jgi:hypothetical protein
LDAAVAGIFLLLLSAIVLLSVREWLLLVGRRKLAQLHEARTVWLPDYALSENKPVHALGLIGLGLALAKELSGEAEMERARSEVQQCSCCSEVSSQEQNVYLRVSERRFNGVRRCC